MALIFNEQFETNPGYDETAAGIGGTWAEVNAGGGTLDKDYAVTDAQTATGLSLPTWGDECLKLAGGTSEVRIRNTFDAGYAELYIRVDLIMGNVSDLPNTTEDTLVWLSNSTPSQVLSICAYKDESGNLKLYVVIRNSGGDIRLPASPYYSAAINTKYRVDLHFVGSGTCECKIDGVSQGTGATTEANINRIYLYKGVDTYQNAITYYDNIQLATDGWVPDDAGTTTHSYSFSESASVSASASATHSASASATPSSTPSSSESASLSSSASSTPSSSISASISLSASASPSPGWEHYSRGEYAALPANDDDLTTAFSAQDYIDVNDANDVRVSLTTSMDYAVHQFKDYVGAETHAMLRWEGQSNKAPSDSPVYLQIYNKNTTTWVEVDSDSTTAADTDFILSAYIDDLTNYKGSENIISCRIYQQNT